MPLFLLQAIPCVPTIWYKDPATITAIIAIATVAYVIATILLWIETKRSVNITRETFENSFLPIVAVPSLIPHNKPNEKEIAFTVIVRNFGNIPAVEVETSASILADGIALSPKKFETGFLLIPPQSEIFSTFILVNGDYQRALKSSSLSFRFSALYEGIAEKKYRYNFEGVYYPNKSEFVITSAKSTYLGKPKQSHRSATSD
jgi:hypothetical protein